jgi:formylglycine-generating enzyme required for sulfatase activity
MILPRLKSDFDRSVLYDCNRRLWGYRSVAGKIFINYRRVESLKDAQHLKTLFDKTFGAECVFLDVRGIDGGANWLQTLERQVAASEAMVVLIGKDWANLKDEHGNRRLDDPHDKVRFEISQALLRNLPIVPVSIDGAPIPKSAQLPDNLMQLTLIQAMHLRAESFTPDAEAIAQRLRVVLAKQRQRGVPKWVASLGVTAALIAGVAAGPAVWRELGLPFLGVKLPGDDQLRADLAAARRRVADAESTVKAVEERFAQAERTAKSAEASQQAVLQRLAAVEKERDSLTERLAAAQKERDEARKEVVSANAKVADLEGRRASDPASGRAFRDCGANETWCPEMVQVPAGKFMMGSADGDADEKPVHEVTIRRPLAVGKFEVTFAEWDACVAGGGCASNKSPGDQGWGKGRRPVINVSWNDAKEYVTWLARKTGQPYRLLTEAEWEYVARAGTTTKYAFGDTINKQQAQFSESKTVEVGSFPASAWGLHDMRGNVWEWVEDCYQDNYSGAPSDGSARSLPNCSSRVLRGGSWDNYPHDLRSAFRVRFHPDSRYGSIGFRVARTL